MRTANSKGKRRFKFPISLSPRAQSIAILGAKFVATIMGSLALSLVLQKKIINRSPSSDILPIPAPAASDSDLKPVDSVPLFSDSETDPTPAIMENLPKTALGRRASRFAPNSGSRGQLRWSNRLSGFYSKYMEHVLQVLRADPSVRFLKLEVPAAILGYQRNLAMLEKGGASLRLRPKTALIPIVAVSRGAKSFLEQMRVTYVDPQILPKGLLHPKNISMGAALDDGFLLLPDLTGERAKRFSFGKR